MFFMSAGVLVTILTLRSLCAVPPRAPTTGRRGDWRAAAWIFIAAWVIAAAAGTKLNGALTGILFVAALLSAAMLGRFINRSESAPPFRAKLILIAGCSTALAVAIFVALNPYLYDAPISKSASILQVEGDWTLKQQIDPGAPLWLGVQKFTAIAGQDFVVPQSVFHLGAMPCLFVAFAVGVAVVLIEDPFGTAKGRTSRLGLNDTVMDRGLRFRHWLVDTGKLGPPFFPPYAVHRCRVRVWIGFRGQAA